MSVSEILKAAVVSANETLIAAAKLEAPLARAADLLCDCLLAGNKILACGNGGSAADVADFTTEFACRFAQDRRPYPALNLAANGSLLTATSNDYGFDEVFARQLRAFGKAGDVLVVVSTSGNSPNIRRALEEAKSGGLKSVALLGRDGGKSTGIADVELVMAGASTARIQEGHKFLLHVFCEIAETRLPRS